MPGPRYRSRTFRRVAIKTPGGRNVIHYRRRKNSKAHCASCKKVLAGVPRGNKIQIKAIPRSARRPERPFGGNLCSPCSRNEIIARARITKE